MNNISLIGNLGKAPETRFFESGAQITTFSIAVRRSFVKQGDPDTDWFQCECWRKIAEIAANYLQVGSKVGIVGRLEFDHWTDTQTGAKRSKPIVKVDRLTLIEKKTQPPANLPVGNSSPAGYPPAGPSIEDDIHF